MPVFNVVTMSGQSNARGQGAAGSSSYTGWRPNCWMNVEAGGNCLPLVNNGVQNLANGGFNMGPEITLAHTIQQNLSSRKLLIIKYAVNGTSLAVEWAANTGSAYIASKAVYDATFAYLRKCGFSINHLGHCKFQGEDDSTNASEGNAFKANQVAYNAARRADFGRPDLPIVHAKLYNNDAPSYPYMSGINDDLDEIASEDEHFSVSDMVTATFNDGIHYDETAQEAQGTAAANSLLAML